MSTVGSRAIPVATAQHWNSLPDDIVLAPFWISSRVTVWLQLFESCTGCQSPRGSSTSCACWFTSHFWDTRRNISQTFWHRLLIFQVDLHCVLHRVSTSSCHGHVDELATEPFLLLHCELGTGYRRSWNCYDQRTCFVVIWKYFCFILSTGIKIWIDSVMRPRSSSRDLLALTETLSVPAVLPRFCTVTVAQLCYCDTLSGPTSSGYLGHYKHFWLIDWLIDWLITDWMSLKGFEIMH